MSSKKFFSKAVNAVSTLALCSVLLGSAFITSAQAMDAPVDEEYNTRIALSASPLQHLDDSFFLGDVWRPILNNSLGDNKQHAFHRASRHFHKLSCHENFKRTLTINTRDKLTEILANRNFSGYALPYPQSICLGLWSSISHQPLLTAFGLKDFFLNSPLLTSVDLKNHCVKGQRAIVLERYLIETSSLKNLNLENNTLFKEEGTHLAQGLSKNTSLTSLTLDEVEWNGSLLFNAINTHPTLKSLSLIDHMTSIFPESLITECTSLTSLHCAWKEMEFPVHAQKIFSLLPDHPYLKTVGFLSKEMNVKNVQILADALKKTTSLTSLNLGETVIDPEAEKIIIGVCKEKNIQLQWDNKKREMITLAAPVHIDLSRLRPQNNKFAMTRGWHF
jgi:hypothetical protein